MNPLTSGKERTSGTPDRHGSGLTQDPLDALRYDGHTDDPLEVAGMMRSMMPAKVRVLDVGCGTGSVTLIANRDRSNDVVAIEPDEARAAVARSRGIDVHVGILDESFVSSHGQFDVVMSSDVLEHQADPSAFLGMLTRALKPGGVILVSVPNVAHWSVRLNLLMGRFDYEPTGIMDATHLRWFTAGSVDRLFGQCGLEILEMRQTAGTSLPVYNRGLFRRIPRRRKKPAIRLMTRHFPLLFGVQHVLTARVKSSIATGSTAEQPASAELAG